MAILSKPVTRFTPVVVRIPDTGIREGYATCHPYWFEGERVVDVHVFASDDVPYSYDCTYTAANVVAA